MKNLSFRLHFAVAVGVASLGGTSYAQTTAGISTTIVFPLTAQTTSFASEVTLFNPGPGTLTASVSFHEASNSSTPGMLTPCTDVTVAPVQSAEIVLSSQCTLTANSHFGLLVVSDKANPKTHNFYGYMRVQNPQGIGFSVEGFPVENFNNQVSDATGLVKQAAAPGYQTNCFVGSLDQPVSYSLKLFNGFSGAQIGNTLTGSLAAFKQFRYLDIFSSNGVNAPAGDQFNVRAEFTQTSGGSANLIGFCTVQDNTSFGADFRVAKSYGSPSGSFFAQGGNAFGTTATLGTTDNNALNVIVDGAQVMHYEQNATSPNVIGGYVENNVTAGVAGATIGGGGEASDSNSVVGNLGTVGGGHGNSADASATVSGGEDNVASGTWATVGGGLGNLASGPAATVPGGSDNVAAGVYSFAAGGEAEALYGGEFVWADAGTSVFEPGSATHGWDGIAATNTFNVRATGGAWFVTSVDGGTGQPATYAYLNPGSGSWAGFSDRASKENFRTIDAREILRKVAAMPISTWNYIAEGAKVRHLGPMSQDFSAAFGLGPNTTTITHLDEGGVAFAAIQGLDQLLIEQQVATKRALQLKEAKIEADERKLATQQTELAILKQRLARMESVLAQIKSANKVATIQQ